MSKIHYIIFTAIIFFSCKENYHNKFYDKITVQNDMNHFSKNEKDLIINYVIRHSFNKPDSLKPNYDTIRYIDMINAQIKFERESFVLDSLKNLYRKKN